MSNCCGWGCQEHKQQQQGKQHYYHAEHGYICISNRGGLKGTIQGWTCNIPSHRRCENTAAAAQNRHMFSVVNFNIMWFRRRYCCKARE